MFRGHVRTVATVASAVLNLESYGVAVVGQVPSGLPLPHLPAVTFDDVKMLLLAGLGITIVGYSVWVPRTRSTHATVRM